MLLLPLFDTSTVVACCSTRSVQSLFHPGSQSLVPRWRGARFAERHGGLFLEASALDKTNVRAVFEDLAAKVKRRYVSLCCSLSLSLSDFTRF